MEIENKYPPQTRGWYNIEAIKFMLQFEADVDHSVADIHETAAISSTRITSRFMKMKSKELREIITSLDALTGSIKQLKNFVSIALLTAEIRENMPKDEAMRKLVDDTFAACGIPKVDEEDI